MNDKLQNKIDKIMNDSINSGKAVGAACLVFKDGENIYSGCSGYADRENKIPMTQHTIFRLFSLSKPVTSVAAMLLIDRGLLSPDDSVSKFIPEFGELFYAENNNQPVLCPSELKIWHLLNMTSGIPYADNWGTSVKAAACLFDEIITGQNSGKELSTVEICRRAASIPLMFKPGDNWYYGISADIMGGIIEIISGLKFSDFLQNNIFVPLGMIDTGFYVPENKQNRFAALYSWQENSLCRDNNNYLGLTDYTKSPAFESGGAGLVSTISDYSRFARMLANKGEFNGIRLISPETFEYMTTPQLNDTQIKGMWERLSGYNYGNLMRNLTNPEISRIKAPKGEIGWDGWTGTFFSAAPSDNIAILYFTQISGAGTTHEAELVCNEVYKNI